ncbi:hypothetical protein ACHAXH_009962 [Discostella pseudostelligera]
MVRRCFLLPVLLALVGVDSSTTLSCRTKIQAQYFELMLTDVDDDDENGDGLRAHGKQQR